MQRRVTRRGAIASAFAMSAIARPALARVAPPAEAQPDVQRRFTEVMEAYAVRADREADPARLDALVRGRGRELRAIVGSAGAFERWICVVEKATLSDDGNRVWTMLSVVGPPGARPMLTNISAGPRNAYREPVPVVNLLRTISPNEAVLASGRFAVSERRGFAAGVSAPGAEFLAPNFFIRLTEVQQPAWLSDLSARSR